MSGLKSLEYVDLAGIGEGRDLIDVSFLAQNVNIKYLDISNWNSVTDISSLYKLKKIEFLDVSHTVLNDINVVTQFNNLKEISFGGSDDGINSLRPLFYLQNLEKMKILYE